MINQKEPVFFQKARKSGCIVVTESPKFDLEAYISNYRGRTRFDRLFLIGTSSTYLCVDALNAAVKEAKSGKDVERYKAAIKALGEIMLAVEDIVPDTAWVDKTTRQVKIESERLEAELRGYKNNLIKESIRMGLDDLGQHYHQIGNFTESVKAYHRERDVCTTAAHVVLMYLHLIQVSIDQANWLAVQSNIQRIETQKDKYSDSNKLNAKLPAALGIALLCSGNYRNAAENFLKVDPRMVSAKLDDPEDEESYNEVLTPNDVAVYGGLCALATMDRNELQNRVLEDSSFRNYLELEPHIRRAISFFVSSKYSSCLSILDAYKPDYLLDIHLHKHLDHLYSQIRSKAIQQYFIPFSCVTLSAFATAFNTDEELIELELSALIKRGDLDGRIDLVGKVLLANTVDERTKVQEEALAMAKTNESTTHLRLLRIQALNAKLEVKAVIEKAGSRNVNAPDIIGNGNFDPYMGPGRTTGSRGVKRLA